MSWSVNAIGKAPAVRAAIAAQFERQQPCVEPEETVRQGVRATLDAALSGFAPGTAVKVAANGSQWTDNGVAKSCTVQMTVENLGTMAE